MHTVKACLTILFKSPNNQSSSSKKVSTVKHGLTKASVKLTLHRLSNTEQETGHYQKTFVSQCTSLSLIISK